MQGIDQLHVARIPFGILSVLQLDEDPVAIHRHIVDLGCSAIGYLFPAETHDTVAELRKQYGATPCADYLIPIFDEWWFNNPMSLAVREFLNIARLIMGAKPCWTVWATHPFALSEFSPTLRWKASTNYGCSSRLSPT